MLKLVDEGQSYREISHRLGLSKKRSWISSSGVVQRRCPRILNVLKIPFRVFSSLLLVGFAGGFRRSELAAIDVEHVGKTRGRPRHPHPALQDRPRRAGSSLALPFASSAATRPVRSCRAWLAASGITSGPVFRAVDRHGGAGRLDSGSVARILQRAARAAGLDAALYAGHSLRAGFCTQAYLNGAPELAIMRQTRHQSLDTVRKYIRDRSLFRDNPAAKLGL